MVTVFLQEEELICAYVGRVQLEQICDQRANQGQYDDNCQQVDFITHLFEKLK
jgi:hypothetical protein